MRNYDEFIEGLRQEVEVPEKVWDKVQNTLSELPDSPCSGKRHIRQWITAAASVAVFLLLGTGFCYAYPAEAERIAAKIPIIGKLFEQVEKDVTFSGDYSEKSEVLTDKYEQQDMVNIVEDSGIKFTASEIYCDGYSIFLTAKVELEDGKLTDSPYYSNGKNMFNIMYMTGKWKFKREADYQVLTSPLEGRVIDDDIFIGMMKIDIGEIEGQENVLELQMTQIGYDDMTMDDSQDITAAHKIDGQWNLSIPFDVDTENAGEILVNQKTESGYGIGKLFVSPYQVIVYSDVPYTTAAEEGLTREDFDQMWEDKTRGMDESVEPPYTYEQYLEEKHYIYNEVAVFNQDGKALDPTESNYMRTVFAVRDLKIDKLHVFLSDDESNKFSLWDVQSMEEARENSIFEVTVDVGE